jgi:hypothetical protein
VKWQKRDGSKKERSWPSRAIRAISYDGSEFEEGRWWDAVVCLLSVAKLGAASASFSTEPQQSL